MIENDKDIDEARNERGYIARRFVEHYARIDYYEHVKENERARLAARDEDHDRREGKVKDELCYLKNSGVTLIQGLKQKSNEAQEINYGHDYGQVKGLLSRASAVIDYGPRTQQHGRKNHPQYYRAL